MSQVTYFLQIKYHLLNFQLPPKVAPETEDHAHIQHKSMLGTFCMQIKAVYEMIKSLINIYLPAIYQDKSEDTSPRTIHSHVEMGSIYTYVYRSLFLSL